MSILLVGQHPASVALSNVLTRLTDVKITHCMDFERAISELQCNLTLYDWILIEANEESPVQLHQHVERIRATNTDTPISFITHQVDTLPQEICPPSHICRVMSDTNGNQILHCALHAFSQPSQGQDASLRTSKHNPNDFFMFEFHAPCKKTA